jgi:SAM-dependent methyltransferase
MSNKKILGRKHCFVCGSNRTRIERKVQRPFIDKRYALYFCEDCKSYCFDKNEYKINLSTLYNDNNRNWNSIFTFSDYWRGQVNRIEKLLQKKGVGLNILDVGCRTGDFLLHWEDEKNSLYGVELNRNNSDISMKRGIKVYSDFIENIDFEIKFDVITCYALLEHISDPKVVLEKIIGILKTDGILVIMIPAIESKLREKLDRNNIHWHMYSPPEHLTYYSKEFLDSHLKKHRINLINRYYTGGGLENIYLKNSSTYKLLKNANFDSLSEYYSSNNKRINTNTLLSGKAGV